MSKREPYRVCVVCWGNICRSPMAERVARGHAEREGLTDVEFVSFGVSSEETGNPIDRISPLILEIHLLSCDEFLRYEFLLLGVVFLNHESGGDFLDDCHRSAFRWRCY